MRKQETQQKHPYLLPWILVAVVALCVVTGVVAGKYITKRSQVGSVKAKLFYFTSDLLDGENHILAQGTKEITFTLGNNADALRYSTVDIEYTVTVNNGGKLDASSGTLTAGDIDTDTITLSGLEDGVTYTVTAKADGGYQKTITGTFTVQAEEPAVYQYLDTSNSQYVLLTVWTKDYDGAVEITFPTTLLPDNTDPLMAKVIIDADKETQSFQNTYSGYTSHVYRFFGSGVEASDFTVTYGGKNAETKTPS